MSIGLHYHDFSKGLRTRRADEGGHAPDEFEVVQNVRVGEGPAKRRKGNVLAALAGSDHTAADLNGSNDHFVIYLDTRVHTLGLYFTVEGLVRPDAFTGNHYIYGVQAAAAPGLTIHFNVSGNLVVNVWDSAAVNTTMTSATAFAAAADVAFQIKRSTSALTLRCNGAAEDSDTISSTLLLRAPSTNPTLGRHAGADYFDGKLDFFRGFAYARPNDVDNRLRFPEPKVRSCLWDYVGDLDSNGDMRDRSRYENHAYEVNTVPETTRLAVIQDAQVTGIHPYADSDVGRKLFVAAGGRIHLATPG